VCSQELEAALHDSEEELLDLQEAAPESGYSPDHLGRLVRDGKIPNAGRRNAPKIRRAAQYEAEVSVHKKGAQPREDQRRIEIWTQALGPDRDPETITKGQITRFERLRRQGRIKLRTRVLKANPSESTIGSDIIFLAAVLNWAVGENLLQKNPIRGYDRPKTPKPKRPVATYDRYERVRAKADGIGEQRLFGRFLGNEQRECPDGECGHLDTLPRDPAKKLLGFHAYRRKWATERKHLPLKDVAKAGGWLDTRSLQLCYQQVDEATLLQVVSEPRKLREAVAKP
jgi:hypothetical protein